MEQELDSVEARVLGALIEKETTTPEYYPLTLNALTAACNQKSNRDPVVCFDEKTVVRTLEELRQKQLVRMVSGADQRVPKYYQLLVARLQLSPPQMAALCVLLLRGPQTVGEIRGRSGRLHEFADLAEVENALQSLEQKEEGALVRQLPRQQGRKESRYAHLLCGEPEIIEPETGEVRLEAAALEVHAENERIAQLEHEVAQLRLELDQLSQAFAEFRKQFD